MDTLQLYDCSLEETLLSSLSNSSTVQFHKHGDEEGMIIFIFDRVIHLNWYVEFSNCVSSQTTFVKITESADDTIHISFIDSVFDYHITVHDLPYDKNQLQLFKSRLDHNSPLLLVVGIIDPETKKPIVVTPSNNRNLPILITLAGFLQLP